MAKLQKVLKVTSIVEIVLAAITFLIALALLGGSAAGYISMGGNIDETSESYRLVMTMLREGSRFFLMFFFSLIVGVLAYRASKNPHKVFALIIFSTFLTLYCLSDLLFGFWDGNRIISIVQDTVFSVGPVICLFISVMFIINRKN